MRINYKSKSKIIAWVIFNNSFNSFMFSALIFSLSSLALIYLTDYYEAVLPVVISISVFAISLAIQMIIYARSSKSVEVTGENLVIHFGFLELGRGGYADFNKKIKLESIISCTVETEYTPLKILKLFMLKYDNGLYNESRIEITEGDYSKPYIKIGLDSNQALYLPVENAKYLCNTINERTQLSE